MTAIDLDEPSRTPGLLIGAAVALAILAGVAVWMGYVSDSVSEGARNYDARMAERGAYLTQRCNAPEPTGLPAPLCACVAAADDVARDCRTHYHAWAIAVQRDRCSEKELAATAREYCQCVRDVADKVDAATNPDERRRNAEAHERCEGLEVPLPLPPLRSPV